jgi:hypothetical protein
VEQRVAERFFERDADADHARFVAQADAAHQALHVTDQRRNEGRVVRHNERELAAVQRFEQTLVRVLVVRHRQDVVHGLQQVLLECGLGDVARGAGLQSLHGDFLTPFAGH